MSYNDRDPDITDIQVINTGEPTHKTDYADNVFYGSKKSKRTLKAESRDRFYNWAKSLTGTDNESGIISSENISYGYTQYTVNEKGKRINDYYTNTGKDKESSNTSEEKITAPVDPQIARFLQAKKEAGLI